MEESKQKLSQPFVPIPISFLNQVIANENIPLSHRVLAVILRQMFDTRKKEQDKLTISYIAKALNYKDRRNIQRKKLRKQKYMELVDYKINNNLHNY